MDKLVLLAQVPENAEAALIKTYLASQDVVSVVNEEISNQLFGSVIGQSGVQIIVRDADYQMALEAMKRGGFERYIVEES